MFVLVVSSAVAGCRLTTILLPALPEAWAAEGRATGLKARGGFEISFEWKNGRVTRLLVDSLVGLPAMIRYKDRGVKVPAEKGKTQWN